MELFNKKKLLTSFLFFQDSRYKNRIVCRFTDLLQMFSGKCMLEDEEEKKNIGEFSFYGFETVKFSGCSRFINILHEGKQVGNVFMTILNGPQWREVKWFILTAYLFVFVFKVWYLLWIHELHTFELSMNIIWIKWYFLLKTGISFRKKTTLPISYLKKIDRAAHLNKIRSGALKKPKETLSTR